MFDAPTPIPLWGLTIVPLGSVIPVGPPDMPREQILIAFTSIEYVILSSGLFGSGIVPELEPLALAISAKRLQSGSHSS